MSTTPDSTTENPPVDGSELIRFHNVTKRFGDNVVLDDLCFDVSSGKHVTLIGPSGSGKTTILRLLMTLVEPDSGTIKVNGDYLFHEERNGKLGRRARTTSARCASTSAWCSSSSTSSRT